MIGSRGIDLTGQKFGRLTALSVSGKKWGGLTWLCRCECGTEKVVDQGTLSRGGSRSCGCLMGEAGIKDRAGERYGQLVVIRLAPRKGDGRARWVCRCDCGKEKVVTGSNLAGGSTTSCGCLLRPFNGDSSHPLYHTWAGIKHRTNPDCAAKFPRYAGRGVRMCARWRNDFQAFVTDMGPRPDGASIDRIDPNGHYEPGNCRWARWNEQAVNRSLSEPRVARVISDLEKRLLEGEAMSALDAIGVLRKQLLGGAE